MTLTCQLSLCAGSITDCDSFIKRGRPIASGSESVIAVTSGCRNPGPQRLPLTTLGPSARGRFCAVERRVDAQRRSLPTLLSTSSLEYYRPVTPKVEPGRLPEPDWCRRSKAVAAPVFVPVRLAIAIRRPHAPRTFTCVGDSPAPAVRHGSRAAMPRRDRGPPSQGDAPLPRARPLRWLRTYVHPPPCLPRLERYSQSP